LALALLRRAWSENRADQSTFGPSRRESSARKCTRSSDQLFPRQQELHADFEVAVLDRVTESVDLGPYALRIGQCRIDVPLWTLP
jgi:hypothetical protein